MKRRDFLKGSAALVAAACSTELFTAAGVAGPSGDKPDLSDARKVKCGGFRMAEISDKVLQVRITGLKPATRYYYKIGADRISVNTTYKKKILGDEHPLPVLHGQPRFPRS